LNWENNKVPEKNLENLETAIEGFLAKDTNPTPAKIREYIEQFRLIPSCNVSDESAELLAKVFETRHSVTMTIGTMLTDKKHQPWLNSARAEIDPYYWNRYKKLLGEKRFSGQVIATLDDVTENVLGLLRNPQDTGPWDRRGMVVGHVQSGKTANYTGLICKAADAGYQVIIVIAGIHNNLRNQTQLRIDEGFVGRDSTRLLTKKGERFVGVGKYDQTRGPVTFTNSVRDFTKQVATSLAMPLESLTVPAIFVIKKNTTTLKNLIDWLKEHSTQPQNKKVERSMLLIDDEADNASINIKHSKDEVSRINGQIRDLLNLFPRSCYIGYTATPFANIFIDPDTDDEMLGDDLFPRNFIVSLDPPTSYFGANRVFLNEASSIVRYIEDSEDRLPLKHRIDFQVGALPESLVRAMRVFILGRAIRLARGHHSQHCTMLVNASRFTGVQRQLRNEIHRRLDQMQSSLHINGAQPPTLASQDPEIAALYRTWQDEYSNAGLEWPEVLVLLHDAAATMRVVEVNSRSSGSLNYADHSKDGLNVIAVGGFSLSRGLTLEGLMVSYFLRNSMMYDTLMQMGRWFGFRPDYDDLCRIWMLEEAEGWYTHITESIEMLRDELRTMEAAYATPEEFGLRVRSHPDALIVTARNKLGSGERVVVRIGLGNRFVETAILKRAERCLENNRQAVVQLAQNLAIVGCPVTNSERVSSGRLLRVVPASAVLGFLSSFDNHPGSLLTDTGPIQRYIQDRECSELAEWDILFAGIQRTDDKTLRDESLGIEISCQRRTAGARSNDNTLCITNKQRVASRGVESTGLTEAEIDDVQQKYKLQEGRTDEQATTVNYPDHIYRSVRTRPLLIVHLLKIEDKGKEYLKPIVAWSISFPTTQLDEKLVEYVVNTTWLRENYHEDCNDEEIGGDDD
jgi:Z1 domain